MSETDVQISIFDGPVAVEQSALCTRDERCKAAADEHFEDCPVEVLLKATFGY